MMYGCIGEKLGHSFSKEIHNLLADYEYELCEVARDELCDFALKRNFKAINVTIPYKEEIIPYLYYIDEHAREIGAVNTVVNRDGKLYGYNSDYYGFQAMVLRTRIDVSGKKVLVLGSGGASVTVRAVLEDLGAQVVLISRSGENHYGNLDRHRDAALIVNTTPVGMYPHNGSAPLSLEGFTALEGVLDLIYNPARTQLLMECEKYGIPGFNGLWMLVAQAKEAAEYFGGKEIPDSMIETVYRKMSAQMQNIVLIGMPGCGKSTIGKILAQKTGKGLQTPMK